MCLLIDVCLGFAVGTVEEQIVQQKDSYTPNHAVPGQQVHQAYTSQATKELDDLMASLSDFKVSFGGT